MVVFWLPLHLPAAYQGLREVLTWDDASFHGQRMVETLEEQMESMEDGDEESYPEGG